MTKYTDMKDVIYKEKIKFDLAVMLNDDISPNTKTVEWQALLKQLRPIALEIKRIEETENQRGLWLGRIPNVVERNSP